MASPRVRHHLVLFFNEDYSKNIPLLERIYGSRFGQISFIVPDHYARLERWYRYPGCNFRLVNSCDRVVNHARSLVGRSNAHECPQADCRKDVSRVIGFKYYFQDFFWQARDMLLASDAEWFWFVADDLMLNTRIDESNILEWMGVMPDNQSVLCQPHFSRDSWVDWFHGDSDTVVRALRREACYPLDLQHWDLPPDPHDSGESQRRVIAGCADFFGCHRNVLMNALPHFHRLAQKKIFVEAAIPNVIMALDPHPSIVRKYHWDFTLQRGDEKKVGHFIDRPNDLVFYHPVKLSRLRPEWINRLSSGTIDA